jgi:hypothetical protein
MIDTPIHNRAAQGGGQSQADGSPGSTFPATLQAFAIALELIAKGFVIDVLTKLAVLSEMLLGEAAVGVGLTVEEKQRQNGRDHPVH